MTSTQFDAIIFDMDGLLVDSEVVWQKAEQALLAERGYEYTDEVRENIIGKRLDEFMTYLHDHYQFTETVEELIDELIERMLNLIPVEVNARPGAQAMIDYVVKNNIPHAIASSSAMVIINATLQAQGWDENFPIRCSADDDKNGKPAPDVYLRAAQRVGVAPERCLALEDSPNGSRAAVAAGMTCYAVPDLSHTTAQAFTDITPHVFESLHVVLEKLNT